MGKMLLFLFVGLLLVSTTVPRAESGSITGEYVEARTASVFAGACHYNGELTTTGRDAVVAWNISGGRWHNIDLAGVRAVAIISAEQNFSYESAGRRSEVIIDTAASEAQANALLDMFNTRFSETLGKVVSVRRGPVSFNHQGKAYSVAAGDLALLKVEAMPNDECCKMPNLVWYSPLVPLTDRKVGYTKSAIYAGGAAGDEWQRSGENSAFYGHFSL